MNYIPSEGLSNTLSHFGKKIEYITTIFFFKFKYDAWNFSPRDLISNVFETLKTYIKDNRILKFYLKYFRRTFFLRAYISHTHLHWWKITQEWLAILLILLVATLPFITYAFVIYIEKRANLAIFYYICLFTYTHGTSKYLLLYMLLHLPCLFFFPFPSLISFLIDMRCVIRCNYTDKNKGWFVVRDS